MAKLIRKANVGKLGKGALAKKQIGGKPGYGRGDDGGCSECGNMGDGCSCDDECDYEGFCPSECSGANPAADKINAVSRPGARVTNVLKVGKVKRNVIK